MRRSQLSTPKIPGRFDWALWVRKTDEKESLTHHFSRADLLTQDHELPVHQLRLRERA